MKKAFCVSLAVVILLAAMSVFAGAYTEGELVFSDDFSSDNLAKYTLVGSRHDELCEKMEVVDGKFHIRIGSVSSRGASRLLMFDIPADCDKFTAEMEAKINEVLATGNSHCISLLIGDNGEASTDNSIFQFLWLRAKGTTSSIQAYTGVSNFGVPTDNPYRAGTSAQIKDNDEICGVGYTYYVKIFVDRMTKKAVFTILNKETGTGYSDYFTYIEDLPDLTPGIKPVVGLFFNGIDAEVDFVKVSYGAAGEWIGIEPPVTSPSVIGAPATDAPATDGAVDDSKESKSNTGLIIGIIAAVVVVCAVVAFVLAKKKK